MSHINHQGNFHTEHAVSRLLRIGETNFSDEALHNTEKRLLGILRLALDKQSGDLGIAYDSAAVSFGQVLSLLRQSGISPVDSRWFRLKAAWYDYTDEYQYPGTALQYRSRAIIGHA